MSGIRLGSLDFEVLNPSEAREIYNEIFKRRSYDLSYYDENFQPKRILDVGAYIGISTVWFSRLESVEMVVAVEPNPMAVPLLEENTSILARSGCSVEVVPRMLDVARSDRRIFYTSDWPSVSGIIEGGWKKSVSSEVSLAKSITLTELLDKYGAFDFIKLDVEGMEQRILRGIRHHLDGVKWLVVEYHPVENTSLDKCLAYVRKAGFANIEVEEDDNSLGRLGNQSLSMIYAWR